MVPNLTAERQALVDAVQDFVAKQCGSAQQRSELTKGDAGRHSTSLYADLAKLGWVGAALPEEYGGSGGTVVDECLVLQELARGGAPLIGMVPSLIVAGAVQKFASEEQKKQILGAISQGVVHAIAMSEPNAGSDVAAMTCSATLNGDTYVVNGQKTWITAAHLADYILLVARSARGERRRDGLTMLHLPADADGVEIRPLPTMAGADVNDVYFDNVRVPVGNVIGEAGGAWRQLMAGLNRERLMMAAQLLGVAQGAFARVTRFVREREQFGSTIGSRQAIRHRLADLAAGIETCEAYVYTVANAVAAQPDRVLSRESSIAKLQATELAKHVTLEGMQMMGGYGYATEFEMEGDVRVALGATIYGGTSEIQREIIAKSYRF